MTYYALRDTPRARAQVECLERLTWLYGDAAARIEANQPDVMKWRNIGGETFVRPCPKTTKFTLALVDIAKAALT